MDTSNKTNFQGSRNTFQVTKKDIDNQPKNYFIKILRMMLDMIKGTTGRQEVESLLRQFVSEENVPDSAAKKSDPAKKMQAFLKLEKMTKDAYKTNFTCEIYPDTNTIQFSIKLNNEEKLTEKIQWIDSAGQLEKLEDNSKRKEKENSKCSETDIEGSYVSFHLPDSEKEFNPKNNISREERLKYIKENFYSAVTEDQKKVFWALGTQEYFSEVKQDEGVALMVANQKKQSSKSNYDIHLFNPKNEFRYFSRKNDDDKMITSNQKKYSVAIFCVSTESFVDDEVARTANIPAVETDLKGRKITICKKIRLDHTYLSTSDGHLLCLKAENKTTPIREQGHVILNK